MSAIGTIKTASNGVPVVELSINGTVYGQYPIGVHHDARLQLEMMVQDAEDYGLVVTLKVDK